MCVTENTANKRGMLAEHDPGYKAVFMTPDKADRVRAFARRLAGAE